MRRNNRQRGSLDDIPRVVPPQRRSLREDILSYLWGIIIAFVLAAIIFGIQFYISYRVEQLWFASVGHLQVWDTIWATRWGLFLRGTLITLLALTATVALVRSGLISTSRFVNTLTGFGAGIVSLLGGSIFVEIWAMQLLADHPTAWNATDPVLGQSVSFYIYTLPLLSFWAEYVIFLFIFCAIGGGAYWILLGARDITNPSIQRHALRCVSIFLAIGAALIAWQSWGLWPYQIVAHGSGATAVNSQMAWLLPIGITTVIAALVLLANAFILRPQLLGIIVLPVLIWLGSIAGNTFYQNITVAPNEFTYEEPYIKNMIAGTRAAYNIASFKLVPFEATPLSQNDVKEANQQTLNNIRIADLDAFHQVLQTQQALRTQYDIPEPDPDRYTIQNVLYPVLIATRELETSLLPAVAQNFVQARLQYTHGYGVVLAPANKVVESGEGHGHPELWMRDIPVRETHPGLPPIKQARIYFGEKVNRGDWKIVDTGIDEFDQPTPDGSYTLYRYTGSDGIYLGSGIGRLGLALFLGDWNIITSNYLKPESRLMLHLNVSERVATVLPFVDWDPDTLPVITNDGRIVQIVDGYTTADTYPYSRVIDDKNYMRNSIKAVVDTYSGQIQFYVNDPSDPLIQSWASIFGTTIQPMDKMPADIRSHRRYPDTYLMWQANAVQEFHVTDPRVFYNKGDLWTIAREKRFNWDSRTNDDVQMKPYYVLAGLPDDPQQAFRSVLPFDVRGKKVMAGYLSVDNDTYQSEIYRLPLTTQTVSVQQFDALMEQDPTFSSQLSLLDSRGSQVARGATVVLPIGNGFLYIRPLYILGQSANIPQLFKVVVGSSEKVAWGDTFAEGLTALVAGTTGTPPPNQGNQPPPGGTRTCDQLVQSASDNYQKYLTLTGGGKTAEAGAALAAMGNDLNEWKQRCGDQ